MAETSQQVSGESQQPKSNSGGGDARRATEGYKPYPAEQKLIDRVMKRLDYTSRTSSRWALERQMFENIAFIDGQQWLAQTADGHRVGPWKAPAHFPTPVDNQIRPRFLGMQARLVKAQPVGRVRPNKSDAKNREGARVADQIGAHIDDVVKERFIRLRASAMSAATGTVVFSEFWDPQGGQLLRIPRMKVVEKPVTEPFEGGVRPKMLPDGTPAMTIGEEPEIDPATQQPVVDEVREGEIRSDCRMLFNCYWDPRASRWDLDDVRWFGEITYADLDWIDQHFPEAGQYVKEETAVEQSIFYESSLTALVGPSVQGTAHVGGMTSFRNGAVLRVYEEKPSREYPKGIRCVVANGVLLYPRPDVKKGGNPQDPNDYVVETSLPIKDKDGTPTGDLSWTLFPYDEVPGRMAGATPVSDMVPNQRKLNGIAAQLLMNRKTLLNPSVLAPKGSGLTPGQVAFRPGVVNLYNSPSAAAAPQVIKGEALPESIYREWEMAEKSMDRAAQDERAGGSEVPPGVKSGIALNFLKERGEENATPRLARWAEVMAIRKRKQLLLAQQHYREPRAVKILGNGTDWQVQYWSGSDLAGNTDVSIDPGSIIPRSKTMQQQLVFDAMEQKLVDPSDPRQRQKLLEELGLRAYETDIGPDVRRAEKENSEMDQGQQVPINDEDSDEVHLMTHIPKIKDPSFESLPPAAQQAHKAHKQAHMIRLSQKKLRQQQAEVAGHTPSPGQNGKGAGGPPEPPGAGGDQQEQAAG